MMGSAGFGISGLVWTLLWIALLILLILAIVWLALRLHRDGTPPAGRASNALSGLGRRYARGEIDRDTYLVMRRDPDDQ